MSADPETYRRDAMALPEGPLETERLILRAIEPDDVDAILEMDTDPDVMHHIPGYLVGPERAEAYRTEVLDDIAAGKRFKFFYVLSLKDSPGEALGWVLMRPTEDGRWIELGYRLVKRAWGQGFVPEASRPLIDIAFNNWPATEVMAVIAPGNQKSSRVVEKLGFTLQPELVEMYDMKLELWIIKRSPTPPHG